MFFTKSMCYEAVVPNNKHNHYSWLMMQYNTFQARNAFSMTWPMSRKVNNGVEHPIELDKR